MRGLHLDRVIVATPDIDAAIDRYADLLGLEFGDVLAGHTNPDAGEQRLSYAYGHPGIEFIAPEADNEVQSFLDDRGPGLYGVVYRVASLAEAVEELEAKGVEPIDVIEHLPHAPEALYHPRDFGGVFTILTEYRHPVELG